MAKIKILNKTRRMLHFNLEHPHFLDQPGQNGVGKPEVLTLLPRETVEIDEAALKCAEVASAVAAKPPILLVVG